MATDQQGRPSLCDLYEWTCRAEEELRLLKSAFPDALLVDRSRLVMSFSCLRVGLELRVKAGRRDRTGLPRLESGPVHRESDRAGRD